ncbi:hypothetical protein F5B21DRAFT_496765 [Xylaria acuta]|nr:hypothetical protein F5B21DRAFT_496765 [Xylaria acuta]
MELVADSLTPLTGGDFRNVFRYSDAVATVVTLLQSQAKIIKEECRGETEWNKLIQEKLPSATKRDGDSGFVLLITPRIQHDRPSQRSKSPTNRSAEDEKTFPVNCETTVFEDEESLAHGGQRHTRVLPFSRTVFSKIARAFYTHRSISPAINRADVPLFSYEEIFMQDEVDEVKARVYNCRSTNAWGGDLAMTVTHFPHCNLSFGILFGCNDTQKKYVLQRLDCVTQESGHPLLLPGIFVELEKKRHHHIFESGIGELELMIPGSDPEGVLGQEHSGGHSDRQNRRTVYLDMLHLKHGLISWSQQLNKMLEHALSLNKEYLGTLHLVNSQTTAEFRAISETVEDSVSEDCAEQGDATSHEECSDTQSSANSRISGPNTGRELKTNQEIMAKANARIIGRINSILEDYSDKIRECETRFDGLAMTTQLFQGETSVLLALAARQDSHHMRTIALVTMVFLPGTFFATVFSMTFFNWQAEDGESTVSSLFWIYVAFSIVSTVATLLVYYYFVTMRRKRNLVPVA